MKKSHILFAFLLALTALILTSCSGLTSAREKTGSFTFNIDDTTAENIARNAGNGSTVSVKVTIKASDGSYNLPAQNRNVTISNNTTEALASALRGMTFTFSEIPFNKTMTLKVDVMVDNELTASSITRKFTLTKKGVKTLEAALHKEFDSPYIIHNQSGKVMVLPADTAFEEASGSLDLQPTIDNQPADLSCCDMNGVFWCFFIDINALDGNDRILKVTDSNGSTRQISVTCPDIVRDDDYFYLDGVYYDSVKDRICLLCSTWITTGPNYEGYKTYYIHFLNSDDRINLGDSLEVSLDEMVTLDTGSAMLSFYNYIYNGYFYSLETDDVIYTKEGASVKLSKYTLENKAGKKAGDLVKTTVVRINRINPLNGNAYFEDNEIHGDDYLNAREEVGSGSSYDHKRFFFNDMAVYDDSVYILFHQEEFWVAPGTYQYSSYLDIPGYEFNGSAQNGGYINRGGILVLDADTLETKGTLGLTKVQSSQQIPLIGRRDWKDAAYYSLGSTYAFFYNDRAMTKVARGDIPLKYALPEWRGKTISFSNPLKIVAVKPKKLVVADSGVFLFVDDDRDTDGTPVVKEDSDFEDNRYYIHVKTASRLITVDLEDFSKSEVTTVFEEDAAPLYENDTSSSLSNVFNLPFKANQYSTSVYYFPEVEFTGDEYHKTGSAVSFTGNGGSDFPILTQLDLLF